MSKQNLKLHVTLCGKVSGDNKQICAACQLHKSSHRNLLSQGLARFRRILICLCQFFSCCSYEHGACVTVTALEERLRHNREVEGGVCKKQVIVMSILIYLRNFYVRYLEDLTTAGVFFSNIFGNYFNNMKYQILHTTNTKSLHSHLKL